MASAKTKRRMPQKTATLDFTKDGYNGFHCEAWLNIPVAYNRRYAELSAESDEREANDLFLKLFPTWDFVDFDGKPIPHTAEGVDFIPTDLGAAMMRRRAEAQRERAMPAPLGRGSSIEPGDSGQEKSSPES